MKFTLSTFFAVLAVVQAQYGYGINPYGTNMMGGYPLGYVPMQYPNQAPFPSPYNQPMMGTNGNENANTNANTNTNQAQYGYGVDPHGMGGLGGNPAGYLPMQYPNQAPVAPVPYNQPSMGMAANENTNTNTNTNLNSNSGSQRW